MSDRSSPRAEMQDRIEAWFMERIDLWDAPYGVLKGKSEDGKARTVTFGRAQILDATILIYGPTFILVKWRTAIHRLAGTGSQKFNSEDAAKKWIEENMA